MAHVYKETFTEGEEFYIADRPIGPDGNAETLGTVNSYDLKIYSVQDKNALVHSESGSVTGGAAGSATIVMVTTPTVDDYWGGEDDIGYTALWYFDPANWDTPAKGHKQYKLRMKYLLETARPTGSVITRVLETAKPDTFLA